MFKYSLFYLFQPIMVAVEYCFCPFYVSIIFGKHPPRQRQQCLQIIKLNIIIRILWIDTFQFGPFLVKIFSYIFGQILFSSQIRKILYILILRCFSQFVLNIFNLLLQEILFLLTVEVFPCLIAYIGFQGSKLHFAVQYSQQLVCSFV